MIRTCLCKTATIIGTWEFVKEVQLTYAFDIKGLFKLETIFKCLSRIKQLFNEEIYSVNLDVIKIISLLLKFRLER